MASPLPPSTGFYWPWEPLVPLQGPSFDPETVTVGLVLLLIWNYDHLLPGKPKWEANMLSWKGEYYWESEEPTSKPPTSPRWVTLSVSHAYQHLLLVLGLQFAKVFAALREIFWFGRVEHVSLCFMLFVISNILYWCLTVKHTLFKTGFEN